MPACRRALWPLPSGPRPPGRIAPSPPACQTSKTLTWRVDSSRVRQPWSVSMACPVRPGAAGSARTDRYPQLHPGDRCPPAVMRCPTASFRYSTRATPLRPEGWRVGLRTRHLIVCGRTHAATEWAADVTFGRGLKDFGPLATGLAGVRWFRCRGILVVCPEGRRGRVRPIWLDLDLSTVRRACRLQADLCGARRLTVSGGDPAWSAIPMS